MKTAAMPARGVPPEVPKGSRKQSTDCTERPRAAANREAVVELIVAGGGKTAPGVDGGCRWRGDLLPPQS